MSEFEPIQITDGSMLGDGGLVVQTVRNPRAFYHIGLSKPLVPYRECTELTQELSLQGHLRYEQWLVGKALKPIGIQVCSGHPKIITTIRDGKPYRIARLYTRVSPLIMNLYDEWYTGGRWVTRKDGRRTYLRGATKNLPERVLNSNTLAPVTLAVWFIEDGSSSWNRHWEAEGYGPYSAVSFATYNFSEEEVYHLMSMLNNMGIGTVKPTRDKHVKTGSGLRIRLAADGINSFMNIVEPYIREISDGCEGPTYYKHLIKWRA